MNYLNYVTSDFLGETNIIVAEDAKSVIYLRYDNEMGEVYLSNLGVLEEVRKQGRGTDIMRVAEEWAIGHEAINIGIESPHELVPFFEKFGYKESYSDSRSVYMRKYFKK